MSEQREIIIEDNASIGTTSETSIPPSVLNAHENPNNEKLQEIREKYQFLLENLVQLTQANGDEGVPIIQLKKFLTEANDLFENVKRAQEARLDIALLKRVVILAKAMIEKTQSGVLAFRPLEFSEKLLEYTKALGGNSTCDTSDVKSLFDLDQQSLSRINNEFVGLYNNTYGLETLFGALEWAPRERAQRRRDPNSRNTSVKAKTVEQVTDPKTSEESQVDEVLRIYNVLRKVHKEIGKINPISLHEFIINPKCFSSTVENLFHVSFLVRDGLAQISPDEFGVPCITPLRKKDSDVATTGRQEDDCQQAVIPMNFHLWKELIAVLELEGKDPMIPSKADYGKMAAN